MRTVTWALALACACGGGGNDTPKDAAIDALPPVPRTIVATVPATLNRSLDLLFVVDDSMNMVPKQEALAASVASFLSALSAIEGGLPDLHIGVATTDMGTRTTSGAIGPAFGTPTTGGCAEAGKDGQLVTNGAALELDAKFLVDVRASDGTRLTNYTGTLDSVLAQLVRVGDLGCGFEQPLHAMKRAVENTAANAGFLRADAKLGIIFLTDEDDCSAKNGALFSTQNPELGVLSSFRCTKYGVRCEVGGTTPEEMGTPGTKDRCGPNRASTLLDEPRTFSVFLRGVKADERDAFVAGIVGDPAPVVINVMPPFTNLGAVCDVQAGDLDIALPAVRMNHFFELLGDRGHFESMCAPDFAQQLAGIGRFASIAIGNACITHTLAMPLDCIVEDDTSTMKIPLDQCGSPETPPCWKLETNAQLCPAAANQRLVIVRAAAPSPETIATMRCAVL